MTAPLDLTALDNSPQPELSCSFPVLKRKKAARRRRLRGRDKLLSQRMEPAEHKKFVAAEIAKLSPIIKAAGVYAD